VTATTTTTIRGVSIFSRQRKRKADVFDIALSSEGIAIQRPGRSDQHMTWERIAQWEIQERPGCLVLTLRGGGSVTPLLVKGWSLEDLETVLREATTSQPDGAAPDAEVPVDGAAPAAEVPVDAAATATEVPVDAPVAPAGLPHAVPSRAAARRPRRSIWKVLVTVVLLGILATAVTLVLLQSAGVINWAFLGPVA
jgi:hypothetical protein